MGTCVDDKDERDVREADVVAAGEAAAALAAVRADAAAAAGAGESDMPPAGAGSRGSRMPRLLARALRFALLLAATSVVSFALVAASPVDPVRANVGQVSYARMPAEQRAELARYWGHDTPLWERYGHWLAGALRGDFGESLRFGEPVAQVVGERFASSAALMLVAWALAGAGGLALGVAAGARQGGAFDRVACVLCYLLSSTPAFWLGLVALVVFSVWLGWFPLGFSAPVGVAASQVSLSAHLYHLILPALVLAVSNMPSIALHTREKTIEVMDSDYARFAASRGESRASVLLRHGLRNLVLPALTIELASVSEVFGGSVLVEQVFSYPGLGQAAVTAGLGGDAPLLVAIALVSAVVVFGGNLLADVLYGVIDPRIREGRASRHA